MMSRTFFHFVLTLAFIALTACQRTHGDASTLSTTASHADSNQINWIKGDVNVAFASAQQQHKPVLLYWGASWCPPCQQLKATVFTQPSFIAKTRLFVPVYLDGDAVGAQKWGDTFHVQGYPTLVILDINQHEVMRIAGGMDLNQYAAVLDIALSELSPIDSSLLDGNAVFTASNCQRFAFNAWTLDDIDPSQYTIRTVQLANLAQRCSSVDSLAAARLTIFAAYFRTAVDASKVAKRVIADTTTCKVMDDLHLAISRSNNDPKLADALLALNEDFFKAARTCKQTTWQPLRDAYVSAMDAAANTDALAAADHITALERKLLASRILSADGSAPKQYVVDARARINELLAQQQTPFIRMSILNSVLNVYDELGLQQEAYDLIRAELPHAEQPYYLKADLAEVTEKLGRNDEALQWWDEAYRESQGAATRFQWGQSYVAALIRMRPADSQQIANIAMQTLTELDAPDRIYRRVRLRLRHMAGDLQRWNNAANHHHDDVLKKLRIRMQQVCVKIPAGEAARLNCDEFLAK